MEIRSLKKEEWKGRKLYFSYTTDGYYDFDVRGWAFGLNFHAYGEVRQKSFEGELFEDWAERPQAFGAFENGRCVGVIGVRRNRGTVVSGLPNCLWKSLFAGRESAEHCLRGRKKKEERPGRGCLCWKRRPAM